jgi:hypothetical protein
MTRTIRGLKNIKVRPQKAAKEAIVYISLLQLTDSYTIESVKEISPDPNVRMF